MVVLGEYNGGSKRSEFNSEEKEKGMDEDGEGSGERGGGGEL